MEAEEDNRYFLPDVMLTCDERDHADRDMKRYPSLVVEIVSPTSSQRDRDVKFRAYLRIPSIKYCVLIAQDQTRVEVFARMDSSKGWSFNYYESLEDTIEFQELGFRLSLNNIYEGVSLIPDRLN
ncbi:MAG: Uma2 family endonuclease [Bacteroidota bacterium]